MIKNLFRKKTQAQTQARTMNPRNMDEKQLKALYVNHFSKMLAQSTISSASSHRNNMSIKLSLQLCHHGILPGVHYKEMLDQGGPRVNTFFLSNALPDVYKKVDGLQGEISSIFSLGDTENAQIIRSRGSVGNNSNIIIEAAKPDDYHRIISPNEIMDVINGPLVAGFGVDSNNSPFLIDFFPDSSSNSLIGGRTRSGKTSLMRFIVGTVMHKCTPRDARFMFIDTAKGRFNWGFMDNSPFSLCRMATDHIQAHQALTWLRMEISRRYKLTKDEINKLPRLFCFIDELADLLSDEDCAKDVSWICSKGIEAGVRIVSGAQQGNLKLLGDDPHIRANMNIRIVGKCDTSSARIFADRSDSGAEGLQSPGDFIVYTSEGRRRIATPDMTIDRFNGMPTGTDYLFDLSEVKPQGATVIHVSPEPEKRMPQIQAVRSIDWELLGLCCFLVKRYKKIDHRQVNDYCKRWKMNKSPKSKTGGYGTAIIQEYLGLAVHLRDRGIQYESLWKRMGTKEK